MMRTLALFMFVCRTYMHQRSAIEKIYSQVLTCTEYLCRKCLFAGHFLCILLVFLCTVWVKKVTP